MRRAEHHAETSAKDPRHIGVPRDLGDDILKKVRIYLCSPFGGFQQKFFLNTFFFKQKWGLCFNCSDEMKSLNFQYKKC